LGARKRALCDSVLQDAIAIWLEARCFSEAVLRTVVKVGEKRFRGEAMNTEAMDGK